MRTDCRSFIASALAALALLAMVPLANAQLPPASDTAARRHAEGIALEKVGNDQGAFVAFLEAAEGGHPPALRKLGEIYDNGNAAVERDYSQSIIWYQRARDAGEPVPQQKARLPGPPFGY
jgi:TPR repeat protein